MIISVVQAQFFFLALTRVLATLAPVPVLGGQVIPPQVRIGLGLGLTILLLPVQTAAPAAEVLPMFGYAVAVGKELLIGTLAGFAAQLTFGAVQIAAETAGLGSGFNSGRVFNPAMGESESAYSQLFMMCATLFFLVIDGHHLVLAALRQTFLSLPIDGALPLGSMDMMLRQMAVLVSAGVQIGLPVLAALTMADLALGLLARVAPQIQVYFLGLPLKIGLAIAALGMLFSVIFPLLGDLFRQIGQRMLAFLG